MSSAANLRPANDSQVPNDLAAWWLPFTANRAFKARPRLIAGAKGMYYYTPDGRAMLDGAAGLWCCNAGHNRDEIVAAIQAQAAELDFAPAFQFGHPKAFALASRIAALAPGDLDHVFFTNSGSEAVDTALKIALAYWNVSGQGQPHAADRPRARLSRRRLRRHLGRRHRQQPQVLRQRARRRRPPAAHLQPRRAGLFARRARMGRAPRRGAGADRRAARRLDHRGGDRRADGRLDRRAAAAQGLPPAPAPDLRPARHPADLRRGHHRLRPPRLPLRGRALRRRARHDHLRQGRELRRRADGRRDRAQGHPRRLHEGPGMGHRALPRLHLFGPSARLRGGLGGAGPLPRRAPVRARPRAGGALGRRDLHA